MPDRRITRQVVPTPRLHNIVQKTLGGRITVESGDGIGTRFTILVPIVSN